MGKLTANDHVIRAAAIGDITTERRRQVETEGWTPEHDDTHASGELADAAACYARGRQMSNVWPWADEWWKPSDRRRELVKAGALIVAEIERLDRARTKNTPDSQRGG